MIKRIKIFFEVLIENLWIFFFPIIFFKLKKFKFHHLEELVSFAFNFWFGLIRPMQIKEEVIEFLKIVQNNKCKNILEIGTAKGGTLFLFSKILPQNSIIISIDLPKGAFGGGYSIFRILLFQSFKQKNQKMFLLRGDSHQNVIYEKVKEILKGEKVDLLFIDGDHTYNGVKNDFKMYKNLVKKDGLIVFHDITSHIFDEKVEVFKVWNEIREKYETVEIQFKSEKGSYGFGIIKNENWD